MSYDVHLNAGARCLVLAASFCALGAAASPEDGKLSTGDFARMDRGQGLKGRAAFQAALIAPSSGWTSTWTRADRADWQTVAGTGHARYELRDGQLVEVLDSRAFDRVCTTDVEVRDDGFTTLGCTGVPKRWVHDQTDAAYPFKGSSENGYVYRLQPTKP